MAKFPLWIKNLISAGANKSAIILLIDFGFMIGEIDQSEKTELLGLVETTIYNLTEILDLVATLYLSSDYLDQDFVKFLLKEYVLANKITQVKANEIKLACGI